MVLGVSRDSLGIMGICFEEGNFFYGRIFVREYELWSGLVVEIF